MAETKNKTAETGAAVEEMELPAYFDLAKAAGIAGASKAQSLLDEVLMITTGDLSQHHQPGVSLRSMELAADDPANPHGGEMRRALKRVRTLLTEAAAANK